VTLCSLYLQEAGSRTREADVILVDLERAQKKIQELQTQLFSQSTPVPPSSSDNAASLASSNSFWEQQIDSRMAQIAALEQQLEASRVTLREEASRHDLLLQQANNSRASLEIQLDQLNHELGKRPGLKQYEDIVQRVESLQLLVDVQMESEGWNLHPPPSSSSLSRPSDAITSLIGAQAAMQERNRKLSSDVTFLKQRLVEAQGSLEEAEKKLAAAQSECDRLSQLARKLEGDLTLTSAPSAPQGGMRDDPTLTLGLTPPPSASSQGGMSQGGMDGSSLVEIVASQRDRFRSRVNQLEEEKAKSQEDLARARKQLDEVRADNVSLYEKLRFLERYQGQQQEASGALGGGGAGVRLAVVKVDEAGIRQEVEEDRKAGRYQVG
jgi:homeobox protein cut-like